MRSQSSKYAQAALSGVRMAEQNSYGKEYGRICQQFPPMVLVNGLKLSVAYLQSKQKENNKQDLASQQFLKDLGSAVDVGSWEEITINKNMPVPQYLDLTRRTLKAVVWFKRYAEAILKVDAADTLES
ncbi:type III-B CRISPR module-associated protein Cmr5 [Paenibacillus sp.]|jgi:CRISPR-associated protein Cmr5|uniref:type III-B CRISPR module-associated protein Cmr5 n=1 Tax=Paenibacillus sp. TaxID=58172 RepID=UPI002820A1D9|nr:type III-B CRISPR module-associated protein Cmr5 [Paenibacillus sp.]MDR0266842.1 type III-B CRISPR module-associated protein Cmr5 [Paenibacillus sp.]